jgi:hypothetical protein
MNFKQHFKEANEPEYTWLDALELAYYREMKEALHSDIFKEIYGPDRIGYDGKPEVPTYKSIAEDINVSYETDLDAIRDASDDLNLDKKSMYNIQWKGDYDRYTNNVLLFIGQFFKEYRRSHPVQPETLKELLKDLLSWAEANPKTIKQAVVDATYGDIKPKTKETFGGMLSEL